MSVGTLGGGVGALVMVCSLLSSCVMPGGAGDNAEAGAPLTVWWHGGTDAERDTVRRLVRDWQDQRGVEVELTVYEEGTYNDHVQAAAAAGTLPDVLDPGRAVDGESRLPGRPAAAGRPAATGHRRGSAAVAGRAGHLRRPALLGRQL